MGYTEGERGRGVHMHVRSLLRSFCPNSLLRMNTIVLCLYLPHGWTYNTHTSHVTTLHTTHVKLHCNTHAVDTVHPTQQVPNTTHNAKLKQTHTPYTDRPTVHGMVLSTR